MTSHPPTMGHQRVLQLLCRVTYVLQATRSSDLTVVYTITKRGSRRHIQTLSLKMVTSLVAAGWIERDATTWTYRVTPIRVGAANSPRSG